MKRSNKILIGGFLVPFVVIIGIILYLTINGTDDPLFKLGDSGMFSMTY